MKLTQRQRVEELLIERRSRGLGVNQGELIYELHITRAAAIIHELRKAGWRIQTTTNAHGTATYTLLPETGQMTLEDMIQKASW